MKSETPSLSVQQKTEFRSGTISDLMEWAPRFIPGIKKAFRTVGPLVYVDPAVVGGCGDFRVLANSDYTLLRARIEVESQRLYGLKFRTDRATISEYIDTLASGSVEPESAWFGELPAHDGKERLKEAASKLGFEPFDSSDDPAVLIEAVSRVLFMHPCVHAMGRAVPVPVVMVVSPESGFLDALRIIARGPLNETTVSVTTPREFVESFDPYASHLVLPGLVPVLHATTADRYRFASIVRQSAATFRVPNAGQQRGSQTLMPAMVGTCSIGDIDAVLKHIPVIPVRFDNAAVDMDADYAAQCYAEAWEKVAGGAPMFSDPLKAAIKGAVQ